jgi:hypothetical protein
VEAGIGSEQVPGDHQDGTADRDDGAWRRAMRRYRSPRKVPVFDLRDLMLHLTRENLARRHRRHQPRWPTSLSTIPAFYKPPGQSAIDS